MEKPALERRTSLPVAAQAPAPLGGDRDAAAVAGMKADDDLGGTGGAVGPPPDSADAGDGGASIGNERGDDENSDAESDGGAGEGLNASDGDGGVQPPSTLVCPAPGGGPQDVQVLLNGPPSDCWAGESWALGTTFASGRLSTENGLILVGAYLFGSAAAARTQVYDAEGRALPGCVVIDIRADRQWREIAFEGATCHGAAFARITAHADSGGDL